MPQFNSAEVGNKVNDDGSKPKCKGTIGCVRKQGIKGSNLYAQFDYVLGVVKKKLQLEILLKLKICRIYWFALTLTTKVRN